MRCSAGSKSAISEIPDVVGAIGIAGAARQQSGHALSD
jgi:hypothetical protein